MHPRLRLAIDGTPLLGPRTGIGVFTHELLARLAHLGVEVTAWSASWRGRGQLGRELPSGIRAARRPMAARPLRAAWRRLDAPPIEWWTGPVDVVHGTNYVVPPTHRGTAALVSVHDLTFLRHPELCTADTLEYPTLLRRALAHGAHVHTDSAFVAGEVQAELGVPAERVHTVPLGVSKLGPSAPGEGAELAGADRYLLALGTVEPRKDLPGLVATFDRVADEDPEVHLVIAGPDGWGADDLARAMAGARHRARINRIGRYVLAHERAALVHDATLLAYPSRYEGFGLPPLEAMQVGVPVVATRTGSLPEVLGDAAEWCAPGDPDDLARALRAVLGDSRRRAALVAAGPEQAARFTWRACADGLLALYRTLAGTG